MDETVKTQNATEWLMLRVKLKDRKTKQLDKKQNTSLRRRSR